MRATTAGARAGRPLLLVVAVSGLVLAACGGTDDPTDVATDQEQSEQTVQTEDTVGADGLHGLTRDPALVVGDQVLPEVAADGTETLFGFQAPPGELLVVYFGYTHCPDFCPTTMSDVGAALDQLGDDAGRVSVAMATIDPGRDTPEILDEYVSFFIEDGHALRTEDLDSLYEVQDAFLASSKLVPNEDGEGYEVEHTASTYVVNDQGEVVAEWPFGVSISAITSDLRELLGRYES